MTDRVAFLGLGAIGLPMAVRLAPRGDLIVWNRTRARAEAMAAEHPVTIAHTPREAAEKADVVITCLSTSADVESVLRGDDGLIAGLRAGALMLDSTSGVPATSRRIAERLAVQGVAFADTPVSGGTDGAAAGTLTVMFGGDQAAYDRAVPVLEGFAAHIEHLGPVGSGHAMKAINNVLVAVHLLALAEGLAALAKAGVAPATALATLNSSSGRSFVSEKLVPERVLTGEFPRTFRLALLDKDAGIALGVAEAAGVNAPLIASAKARLAAARQVLDSEADYLEAVRLVEEEAGVELRV